MENLLTKSSNNTNNHINLQETSNTPNENGTHTENDTLQKKFSCSESTCKKTSTQYLHKLSYAERYHAYPVRQWILGLASFFSMFQNWNWSLFSNTPETFEVLFHFDDNTQSHLLNIGSVGFLAQVQINSQITDNISFKFSTLHNSLFVLIGCLLRVAAFEFTSQVQTLCQLSAVFMALPGPWAEASGTVISSRWFKPEHRTMSTGIFSILNAVGPMLGSVIGPAVLDNVEGDALMDRLKQQNQVLTLIAVLTVLLIAQKFPEKPRTPVSPTAEVKRLDQKQSFSLMIRNKHFLILCGLTCITVGTNQPLSCMLTAVLTKSGVTQLQSGYIGATSGIAMIFATFVISQISDAQPKNRKQILAIVVALSLIFLILFVGLVTQLGRIKGQNELIALVGACQVMQTFFTNGLLSMSFEMMCELIYPIPESLSSSFCTFWINIVQLVTLIVPLFTGANYLFLWFILAVHSCAMILVLMQKHSNNRLNQEHD